MLFRVPPWFIVILQKGGGVISSMDHGPPTHKSPPAILFLMLLLLCLQHRFCLIKEHQYRSLVECQISNWWDCYNSQSINNSVLFVTLVLNGCPVTFGQTCSLWWVRTHTLPSLHDYSYIIAFLSVLAFCGFIYLFVLICTRGTKCMLVYKRRVLYA